jgi:hypothetical protein
MIERDIGPGEAEAHGPEPAVALARTVLLDADVTVGEQDSEDAASKRSRSRASWRSSAGSAMTRKHALDSSW